MLAAIDFNDEFLFEADEIGEIGADGMLSLEFKA